MTITAEQLRENTLKVIDSLDLEIVTPGTVVHPVANTDAVYCRIVNNSGSLVMVGMQDAGVDATASPVKGYPLLKYDSRVLAFVATAAEICVDSVLPGNKVTVEYYGRG